MPSLKHKYLFKTLSSQASFLISLLSEHGFLKVRKDGSLSLKTPHYGAYCFIFYQYIQRFKLIQKGQSGWLSLQKKELNDRFKGWDCAGLERAGLLEIDGQYKPGAKSRSYRIPEAVLDGWGAARDIGTGYVNLKTGQAWTEQDEKALRQQLEQKWQKYPDRMLEAAQSITESYFSLTGIETHLKRLRNELAQLLPEENRYQTKRGELINDELCLSALLNFNPDPLEEGGLYRFQPLYQPLSTGRIGMLGGALQSCTREMKLAAYSPIEDMRNYDLASSQARICFYLEFPKWNIDCPWMSEYLKDRGKRRGYPASIGILDPVWKECLSALLMGAKFPSGPEDRRSAILQTLRKEVTDDKVELERIIGALREAVSGLLPALRTWHWRIKEELKSAGVIANAMGVELYYTDLPLEGKRGKIASHILQGAEAYFIQELTLLAPQYGFRPIANEHDGLIVRGEIPAEAVEEAKRITGMSFVELETKQDFGTGRDKVNGPEEQA